jgi:hypothetical protein
MEEPQAQAEMPRYKCHKIVHALKLFDVARNNDGTGRLVPENSMYGPITVGADYMQKHDPQAGGYYVVYEGGYQSWSPGDVFETGYTRIE